MELYIRHQEREERVRVERNEEGYRVVVGERSYAVDLADRGPALTRLLSLLIEGRQTEVSVRRRGDGRYWISSHRLSGEVEVTDPLTRMSQKTRDDSGKARGPHKTTVYMPGRVVSLLVAEGDAVTKGQGVLVIEAMKMENEIEAESDGVVRRIFVEAGQAVEAGDPLFEVE